MKRKAKSSCLANNWKLQEWLVTWEKFFQGLDLFVLRSAGHWRGGQVDFGVGEHLAQNAEWSKRSTTKKPTKDIGVITKWPKKWSHQRWSRRSRIGVRIKIIGQEPCWSSIGPSSCQTSPRCRTHRRAGHRCSQCRHRDRIEQEALKNMICSTCWLFARAKRWQAQTRKRASWGFNSFWSPALNLNASSFVNFMMNVDIFIEYYYWVRSRWLFWTPTFMAGVETCTEFAGKLIETRFIVLAHNCRWFIFTNNSQEGFTVRGGPSSQRMI